MIVKYYLRVSVFNTMPDILKSPTAQEWQEVSETQFVKAERAAGFYPNYPDADKPCTAGFSGNGIEGKIAMGEARLD